MLDVHILLNTIHSPSVQNTPASSSWIPVCLPKYNSAGFANTYVSFLQRADDEGGEPENCREVASEIADTQDGTGSKSTPNTLHVRSDIVLVCISAGSDFDIIRGWCDSVVSVRSVLDIPGEKLTQAVQRLEREGFLKALTDACISGQTEYSVSDLSIPGLRHFVYKSRSHVQITFPMFEDPYDVLDDRRR